MSMVPSVYYYQTEWIDVGTVGHPPEKMLTTDRRDVEVEGRFGADNGMYYWRARYLDPEATRGGPGAWSAWRSYEPGTVVTQSELYWKSEGSWERAVTVVAQREVLDELRDPGTGLLRLTRSAPPPPCEECGAAPIGGKPRSHAVSCTAMARLREKTRAPGRSLR